MSESQTCIECGTERIGSFCHGCGQRFLDERLSFRWIGFLMFNRLFNLDGSFLKTFIDLIKSPGTVASDYIKGHRSRYVNPITYLLVGGAFSLFAFNILGGSMEKDILAYYQNTYSSIFNAEQMDVFLQIQKKQIGYTTQVYLLVSMLFAFLLRLFFWKAGFNLTETFVFVAFVFGHILLLDAIMVPILILITDDLFIHIILTNLLFVVIASIGAWGFYGRKILNLIKVVIAMLIALFSIQSLILAVIIAYVVSSV